MRNKLLANCLLASTFVGFASTSCVRAQENDGLAGASASESAATENPQGNASEASEASSEPENISNSSTSAQEISQIDNSFNTTSENSTEDSDKESGGSSSNGTDLNTTAPIEKEESEEGGTHVYVDEFNQTDENKDIPSKNSLRFKLGVTGSGMGAIAALLVALAKGGFLPGSKVEPEQNLGEDAPQENINSAAVAQPSVAKEVKKTIFMFLCFYSLWYFCFSVVGGNLLFSSEVDKCKKNAENCLLNPNSLEFIVKPTKVSYFHIITILSKFFSKKSEFDVTEYEFSEIRKKRWYEQIVKFLFRGEMGFSGKFTWRNKK